MTTSNWKKAFTQLNVKPVTKQKYIKHNTKKERTCGKTTTHCVSCGTFRAINGKYGLNLCRKCFRDYAQTLGFKKYC
jgi:small subunit ribosomal protein S14